MAFWYFDLMRQKPAPHFNQQRMQINALDGVRGLAVLLVLFSHLSAESWYLIPGLDMAGTGKTGVYLFFFLSAFLLTLPFLNCDAARFSSVAFWRHYALRRVLRIWPLYLLILFLSVASSYLFAQINQLSTGWPFPITGEELIRHLFLLEGKDVLWSIPVEFKYYFLLPLVALVLVVLLRKSLWQSVMVIAIAIAAVLWFWPPADSEPADISITYYLPIFFLGQLAALIHWHLHQKKPASHVFPWLMELLAIASLLLMIAIIPAVYAKLIGSDHIRYSLFHKDFLLYGLIWGGFVLGTINGKGWLARFFSLPWLRYVGFISFGVYLWHRGIMRIVIKLDLDNTLVAAWVTVVLSIFIASISYRFIEKPFLKVRV